MSDLEPLPQGWPVSGIRPHPIAGIFRLMDDDELAELAASIDASGLREQIVIYEGQILDGRNRYLAAVKAGVIAADVDWRFDPHFIGFGGIGWPKDQLDPLEFVWDHNFHRRHDDKPQRALAAARYHERRQGARTDLKPETAAANLREVAERAGVSERLVSSAHVVLDHGAAELVEAVEQGKLALHVAEKAARELTHIEQRIIAEYPDKKSVRTAARQKLTAPELPSPMSRADLANFAEIVVREAHRVAERHGGRGASMSADMVLDEARKLGIVEAGEVFSLTRPMLLVLGKLRDAPEGPKAEPAPPPPALTPYEEQLAAASDLKGKHTMATAEPILRAGVEAGNITRRQMADDLGTTIGTVQGWTARLKLTGLGKGLAAPRPRRAEAV